MSENKNEKYIYIPIAKVDEEERTVTGKVLIPEESDLQSEIYSHKVIKDTEYDFMINYQNMGYMHKSLMTDLYIVESYLAPVDFEMNGELVKKGTWMMTVKVMNDGTWKMVKNGEITGFSIGGYAWGYEIDEDEND